MRPYPDSAALLPTQSIGNNHQVGQAPARELRKEVVAETLARRGEGPNMLQWNATMNIENQATMARLHPQDRGWGSIRILTTGNKPSLASLARPQSASSKVPQEQGSQDNAKTSTIGNAISAPANGLPGFSFSSGGRQAEISLAPVLATSPPSNPKQSRPCASSANAVPEMKCNAEKSMVERATDCRSANIMPICHFESPNTQSINSPPHVNVEPSCPMEWNIVSVGKGGHNTPNAMESVETGKRLGHVLHIPQQLMRIQLEPIGDATQAPKFLSQNSPSSVAGDLAAGRGDGKIGNSATNAENTPPSVKHLPEHLMREILNSLQASVKHPLPSLARLWPTPETVPGKEGMENNTKTTGPATWASSPANGLLGISIFPGGRDAERSVVPALRTAQTSNAIQRRPRSRSASAVSAIQNNKKITLPTTSPSIPASGFLRISSSLGGRQVDVSPAPALPTLPPFSPTQIRPWSSSANDVAATKDGLQNAVVEEATVCRSGNTRPVFNFPSPPTTSLISTPYDLAGDSCPMEWDTVLFGTPDQNNANPLGKIGPASGVVPLLVQTEGIQTGFSLLAKPASAPSQDAATAPIQILVECQKSTAASGPPSKISIPRAAMRCKIRHPSPRLPLHRPLPPPTMQTFMQTYQGLVAQQQVQPRANLPPFQLQIPFQQPVALPAVTTAHYQVSANQQHQQPPFMRAPIAPINTQREYEQTNIGMLASGVQGAAYGWAVTFIPAPYPNLPAYRNFYLNYSMPPGPGPPEPPPNQLALPRRQILVRLCRTKFGPRRSLPRAILWQACCCRPRDRLRRRTTGRGYVK